MTTEYEYNGQTIAIEIVMHSPSSWKYIATLSPDKSTMVGHLPRRDYPTEELALAHAKTKADQFVDRRR